MKVGIEVSIDVTKIDKARLFQGKKGKYLTMTTFVDLNQKDQYDNNGFIAHKKNEGEQGNTTILGNVKVFWSDAQQGQPQQQQQPGSAYQQHNQRAQQQAPYQQKGHITQMAPQQAKPQDFSKGGDKFDDSSIPF